MGDFKEAKITWNLPKFSVYSYKKCLLPFGLVRDASRSVVLGIAYLFVSEV